MGGIADIYSRLIGNRWTEAWGQPVVIENRTGAGGNIGADLVAKAAPDGYTIGIGSIGTHAVNVTLFSKMPFDPVRDFAPIALLLEAEGLLVLHPSVPAQNVAGADRARARQAGRADLRLRRRRHREPPRRASCSSRWRRWTCCTCPTRATCPRSPTCSPARPRSSSPPCPPSCRTPRRASCARSPPSARRAPRPRPNCPTVAETLPGFDVTNWVGFFAPAGTPPDIVRRLNAETDKFMHSKEIETRLTNEGARFIPMTPEQFGDFVKAEIAKWAPVVKASGAKAD